MIGTHKSLLEPFGIWAQLWYHLKEDTLCYGQHVLKWLEIKNKSWLKYWCTLKYIYLSHNTFISLKNMNDKHVWLCVLTKRDESYFCHFNNRFCPDQPQQRCATSNGSFYLCSWLLHPRNHFILCKFCTSWILVAKHEWGQAIYVWLLTFRYGVNLMHVLYKEKWRVDLEVFQNKLKHSPVQIDSKAKCGSHQVIYVFLLKKTQCTNKKKKR